MGAAAYNRGSRAISAQIDAEMPSAEKALFDDLLEVARASNGYLPLGPGVVRIGPTEGEFSLMNREEKGWASQCFRYRSLWQVARDWRIAFTERGRDQHSEFIRFMPLPRGVA